jgi:ubiquinone/menaquinone biosynthesis C-methylase UbiE
MITFCPDTQFDLVTCTGDALNHIRQLTDIQKIFDNVYRYTSSGGYFIFDILNENEVSTSEPFEMDFDETTRVWFQMTRPEADQVNLKVRVFEQGKLQFEENIHETVHDPVVICEMLRRSGFVVELCADRLLEDSNHGTTWFVVARKPIEE